LGERLEGVQKRTASMEVSRSKGRQLCKESLLSRKKRGDLGESLQTRPEKFRNFFLVDIFSWKMLTEIKII